MWTYLVRIILRNRLGNLIIIALLTAFMLYKAFDVQLSYQLAQMLPTTDSTYIKYNGFKEIFGEDGSVLFIGIQDENIYELNKFNDWYDLTYRVKDIEGVEEVVSIAKMYQLTKNEETKKFDFLPVISKKPYSQEELDSLKEVIYSLPFYDGLLYNKESNVTLMMITLDKAKLNTKGRIPLIKEIQEVAEDFGKWNNVKMHFSGLPYIRTITSKKVEDELKMFVLLALLVASIALFIFFKSFKAMMFPMIIVVISVIWSFGLVSLFGYKITMLTGIIPPLLIVIGVENCIFLLNKYHYEYKKHGNKVKALSRVVQRVGNAAFLTNLTTAIGFAAFIVTGNKILVEFGIIASINIMIVFFLSIFLIPIFYSYLDPPK
ncbi:MAG: MMPL family transporter, partial [Bacteroidales bacterium]|nr:MMPL family transporter [Bacteroidales bacterium]